MKIKIITGFIFIFIAAVSYAETPFLKAADPAVAVDRSGNAYAHFILSIPSGYVYGNPKGPGTGKPLILSVSGENDSLSSLISIPEKYVPQYENNYVYVYHRKADIYIPFTTPAKKEVSLFADGLFCTNERCTPFTSQTTIAVRQLSAATPATEDLSSVVPITTANKNIFSNISENNKTLYKPYFIQKNVSGLLQAIIFGLVAGLLLNFMPCVLPVLSLKILSVTSHSENRRESVFGGLSYSTGIIASFMLLAALVSFAGYGWGFLFQRIEFVLAMTLFLFLMGLSLFGIFSLPVPGFAGRASAHSIRNKNLDSFIKGMLAALLATPCSGPLLGATLAWSITRSPVIIFSVFFSIGIGMTLPFLIISFFPKFTFILPKPGNWMIILEKILGFLLFGSVIYFLSILNNTIVIPSLIMLLLVSFGAYLYGTIGMLSQNRFRRTLARVFFIITLVAGLSIPLLTFYAKNNNPNSTQTFSIEKFNDLKNKNVPIAVQFTADWCPNCRLVEKTVLFTKSVRALFEKDNIILLTADITNKGSDAEILLHEIGSTSIPFLAFFPAGKRHYEPVCLRDMYTKNDVKEAVKIIQ